MDGWDVVVRLREVYVLNVGTKKKNKMLIKPLFQQTHKTDSTLCEIDTKVLQWSKSLLDSLKYGLENEIDYNLVNELLVLREIYKKPSCQKSKIKSLIDQITNSNC